MDSFRFFSNRQCRYFPCHRNADPDNFSCLFCYCPLHQARNCGGLYAITESGVKDCSNCLFPHLQENYAAVVAKLDRLLKAYPFPENGLTI